MQIAVCVQSRLTVQERRQRRIITNDGHFRAARAFPHVELLCYLPTARDESAIVRSNDVAATRLIFDACSSFSEIATPESLIDPDGHHLVIPAAVAQRLTVESVADSGSSPAFVEPE